MGCIRDGWRGFELDFEGALKALVGQDFQKYGLELVDLFVNSITPPDDVQKMIEESLDHAFDDLKARQWIEAKIRAKLVSRYDVRSVNFRWRAVQGQVHVLGSARSDASIVSTCGTAELIAAAVMYGSSACRARIRDKARPARGSDHSPRL